MATVPDTSTTLLRDLAQDSQHARWGEFVARYRPMMEAFMRERFPSVDADDVIQETFVALCRILPAYRYAPEEKGHFRNYLTGVLRNKALRVLRQERRQTEIAVDAGIFLQDGRVPARTEEEEKSWRESLFEIALRQFMSDKSVADRTKRILERTAINGESPEVVAGAFKMTRHAVDQAKSRALARIRALMEKLEAMADA